MSLRESVIITTPLGSLRGELFVGADGLPEINVVVNDSWGKVRRYHQALFPAAWRLRSVGSYEGPLLEAWLMIECVRENVQQAQRDADTEERREPDCMDLGKAYLEAHGER